MPKLPDFIIIGAPRCGTSALVYNLSLHPEIYIAKIKNWPYSEIYFFNKHASWNKGLSWYRGLFKEDKICGEKTPTYYLSYNTMKKIKSTVPDVKLIFCIRDPIERAYSHYKNLNLSMSLSEAIDNYYNVIIEPGFYYKYLRNNVYHFFNKKNVLIINQEIMYKNTNIEMQKVFKYLGVRNFIGKFRRKKSEYRISNEEYEILENIYGEKLGI